MATTGVALDASEGPDQQNDELCWICFDGLGRDEASNPLLSVCKCPTRVHRKCMARWQLYCAGKKEERSCRFCSSELPDWKQVLTHPGLAQVVPVISICYGPGLCRRIQVKPGPTAMLEFISQLQQVAGRVCDSQEFTFRCRHPDTGEVMYMHGLEAVEATLHCACVQAARRQALERQVLQPRGSGTATATATDSQRIPPPSTSQHSSASQQHQHPGGGLLLWSVDDSLRGSRVCHSSRLRHRSRVGGIVDRLEQQVRMAFAAKRAA